MPAKDFKKGMVDIGDKVVTQRTAMAVSDLKMGAKAFKALMNDECPKGDVLETAKIAGIMAAKSTSSIIPMCHPLSLAQVTVEHKLDKKAFTVQSVARVKCSGKTGVEMEALLAASISSLTIYDMMKWADKGMTVSETRLLEKSGGKSGDYKRP